MGYNTDNITVNLREITDNDIFGFGNYIYITNEGSAEANIDVDAPQYIYNKFKYVSCFQDHLNIQTAGVGHECEFNYYSSKQ